MTTSNICLKVHKYIYSSSDCQDFAYRSSHFVFSIIFVLAIIYMIILGDSRTKWIHVKLGLYLKTVLSRSSPLNSICILSHSTEQLVISLHMTYRHSSPLSQLHLVECIQFHV